MKRKAEKKTKKNIQKKKADNFDYIRSLLDINKNKNPGENLNKKENTEKRDKKGESNENKELKEKEIESKVSEEESNIKVEKNMKQKNIMSEEEREYWLKYLEEINLNNTEDKDNLELLKTNKLEKRKESENEDINEELSDNNESSNKSENIEDDINLVGIPDKEYFQNLITNNQGSQLFLKEWFKFKDVEGDGNCGYRAIANQLLGNEEYHNIIRTDVYNYLKLNLEQFTELVYEVNGEQVTGKDYIEKVKNPGFWMGDLELSVINKIYDVNLYLFEERKGYINLLSNWGNIYDNSKIFINICFVGNNHYNVLYELKDDNDNNNNNKNIINNNKKTKKLDEKYWKNIKNKTMKKDKDLEIDLQFVNDNRTYKYKDIYNYIKCKEETGSGIYPAFIYDIEENNRRKNKKNDFKETMKKYYIDKKTKRLKIKYRDNSSKEPFEKDYFVAYQIEKNNLVKRLHEESIHKGEKSLYLLIRNGIYWWYGMYEDVKDYVKNCSICQQLHKTVNKKPDIKQIITKGPRERYVVDLVDIDEEIQDGNKQYKYILNIIDHYSKLVGSYLLIKKTAKDVLFKINDFICRYGQPGILQCDHGKEFDNKSLKEYCQEKNIKLIYSGVRHPTTNGVVEAVHKDIVNSLKAEKLEKKNKYDLNFSISNAARAHNKNIHTVTKYSPEYLFYNYTEELSKEVVENMKKSQAWRKKNLNPIKPNSKVLVSIYYIRKGNTLYCNKVRATGKKCIPGIVTREGSGSVYPIKIKVNYKDLIINTIYNIDYHLVKEVNESVYDKILKNFNSLISIYENEE